MQAIRRRLANRPQRRGTVYPIRHEQDQRWSAECPRVRSSGCFAQRRFLPFFGAQAFGAFNDNVYKNVLVILATYHAATLHAARRPSC